MISCSARSARPADRTRRGRGSARAAVLGLAVLGGLHAAEIPSPEDLPDPLSAWRAGPAKYLITGSEDKTFKRLRTDDERLAFIRRFWKKRDPSPETPENELYEIFRRRVDEANRTFTATVTQGWKTDRGRIYILLGPPDERQMDPVQKEGRGQIRWIYRGAPTSGTGPNQIIAYREDPSGEYLLSTRPEDYGHFLSFVTRSSLRLSPTAEALEAARLTPGITRGELETEMTELGRAPAEEDLLSAIVRVEERPDAFPFLPRFDFYRSEDGLTFVAINIGVKRAALPDASRADSLLPVARLELWEDPTVVYDFVYRNPFVAAPDNADVADSRYLLFQAGQGIPPGRYRGYLGIFDRNGGEVASRHREVVVPEFRDDRLSLSSLTLARSSEPLPPGEATGPYKLPFVLGARRLIPRLETAFRNGEQFSLYYQVYGSQPGPDGERDLAANYRFFVQEDGEFRLVGPAIVPEPMREQVVGWTFPLRGWPTARFLLQVQVTDRVTGQSAIGAIEFTVDE